MQFEDRALAPYQGSEPYIFLSYSHRDAAPAAEIIRDLNLDGFRIWYDEGLVPGKEWDENIARAIMNCSYFVALMSANYLDSANCRDELNFARDKKLPLLKYKSSGDPNSPGENEIVLWGDVYEKTLEENEP